MEFHFSSFQQTFLIKFLNVNKNVSISFVRGNNHVKKYDLFNIYFFAIFLFYEKLFLVKNKLKHF